MKRFPILVCLMYLLCSSSHAEGYKFYMIGNSLTWDSVPGRLKSLINGNRPETVDFAFHIACNKSLNYIVNNPDYTCVTPRAAYGPYMEALVDQEWDIITLQAFQYPGHTAAQEVAATIDLIELAISDGRNQDCIFYLYLAWPVINPERTFYEEFNQPFAGPDEPVLLSNGFLDYWYENVVAAFPDLDIRVSPVGQVLAQLDAKLRETPIGSYESVYDLYRDSTHMNYDVGQYIITLSMGCALLEKIPQEMFYSEGYEQQIGSELYALTIDVLRDVMTSESRTSIMREPQLRLFCTGAGTYECSYIGKLQESTDLINWDPVPGASSPYRFEAPPDTHFFRSVAE